MLTWSLHVLVWEEAEERFSNFGRNDEWWQTNLVFPYVQQAKLQKCCQTSCFCASDALDRSQNPKTKQIRITSAIDCITFGDVYKPETVSTIIQVEPTTCCTSTKETDVYIHINYQQTIRVFLPSICSKAGLWCWTHWSIWMGNRCFTGARSGHGWRLDLENGSRTHAFWHNDVEAGTIHRIFPKRPTSSSGFFPPKNGGKKRGSSSSLRTPHNSRVVVTG